MLSLDVYQDFLLAKELQGVSPSTIERYRYSIEMFLVESGNPEISAIESRDIRHWLAEKTYSKQTLAIDIKNLRTFFRWTVSEGYRDDDPMTRIPTPKLPDADPKTLSETDVSKLVRVSRRNPRDLAVVLTLLDSAVRASELGSLQRTDVDVDTGILTIRHGKGGKTRQAYVSTITCRALRRYLSTRKDSDPAMFLSQRGEPLDRNSIRLLMYRLCDRADVQRHGPHSLRHTAATSMARQGCDAWSLQQILGHADTRVSLRYIWLTNGDVQQAHQRCSPVMRLERRL